MARLIAAFRVSHSNTVQYIRNSPARAELYGRMTTLAFEDGLERTIAWIVEQRVAHEARSL